MPSLKTSAAKVNLTKKFTNDEGVYVNDVMKSMNRRLVYPGGKTIILNNGEEIKRRVQLLLDQVCAFSYSIHILRAYPSCIPEKTIRLVHPTCAIMVPRHGQPPNVLRKRLLRVTGSGMERTMIYRSNKEGHGYKMGN